jgi:hypothetical protein
MRARATAAAVARSACGLATPGGEGLAPGGESQDGIAPRPVAYADTKERAEQQRREKLALIRGQLESGELTMRHMHAGRTSRDVYITGTELAIDGRYLAR